MGMERIGVARSMPIVNTSPIFSPLFAVTFLGEVWPLQNIVGTGLVILGVIILSLSRPLEGEWNRRDVIFRSSARWLSVYRRICGRAA
jgi:drug/metabolite transporter (DMT)-like permease